MEKIIYEGTVIDGELVRDTRVVNINGLEGRGVSDYVYIGRGSGYGNPFVIGSFVNEVLVDRVRAIELYREYLRGNTVLQRRILKNLRGRVLGCHCKPLACHGDVIVEFIKNTLVPKRTPGSSQN